MIIFGTAPRVIKDKNISAKTMCPICQSENTYFVMIGRIPHIFFIPIPLTASDEGPGLYCKNCKKMFEIEGQKGYLIEKYYNNKISKEELFKKLK